LRGGKYVEIPEQKFDAPKPVVKEGPAQIKGCIEPNQRKVENFQ